MIRGVIFAIIVTLLDQWTKLAMLDVSRKLAHPVEVTSFFNLYTVWNPGVSFGMFNNLAYAPWIFSGIAIVVVIILLIWMKQAENQLVAYGLALVIGGAIGNTIDRIRFGAVIDFLDFHLAGYHWPAFNIADTAIFLGVVALLWDSIFRGSKQHVEEKAKDAKHEKKA